jgi:hypothetical protein
MAKRPAVLPAVTVNVVVVPAVMDAGVVAELPDKAAPDIEMGTSKSLAGLSLEVIVMAPVVEPANILVG